MVSLRGVPDFIGVVKGRFVALELKTSDGTVDKLQAWTLKKLERCGAYAKVVTPENYLQILKELGEL